MPSRNRRSQRRCLLDFYRVEGHLERQADEALDGWCWSRDRPRDRLSVEILADDAVIATVVADVSRRDLVRDGIGDGRHAFRVSPLDPRLLDGVTMISAREHGTGAIFGRFCIRPVHRPVDPRLDKIGYEIAELRMHIGALHCPQENPARELRAGFAAVGVRLAAPTSGPALVEMQPIVRNLGRLAIPVASAPACSIVVWSAGLLATGAAIAGLAPALACRSAELIVTDTGRDPRIGLLGTAIPGATVLPVLVGQSIARALADAVELARGRHVIVLADDGAVSAAGMITLIDELARGTALVIGDRVVAAAEDMRVVAAFSPRPLAANSALPLLLAFDRALFERVGGLDATMGDSEALAALDFCLRAAVLDVPTRWLRAPPRGQITPMVRGGRATASFRDRWRGLSTNGQVA